MYAQGIIASMKLMTRDEFRKGVFERDGYMCVVPGCNRLAEDAHHIIERRLWDDGGYYLENGASLCDIGGTGHHMDAEKNIILPSQLREWCGITEVALPKDWDDSLEYNKWGDVVNWTGKYPRTFHLPSSLTKYKDDRVLQSLELLKDKELVVTEKMDGENTTMTRDRIHARSVDSASHPSQSYVRSLWSKIRYDIPEGFRICGENLYALHSVEYTNLPTYFMVFNIWDGQTALSWDETALWCQLFGLQMVPELYRGFSLDEALKAWNLDDNYSEGFVVRPTCEIPLALWSRMVGKHVRANHVRTLDHGWRFRNDFKINGLG